MYTKPHYQKLVSIVQCKSYIIEISFHTIFKKQKKTEDQDGSIWLCREAMRERK